MKLLSAFTVACLSVVLFCGCQSIINHFDGKAQYYAHKVIIHDTVYDDYLTADSKWDLDKSKAKQWLYYDALRWLDDFRKNERGEYADTGAKDYPVKIEPVGDGKRP